MGHLKGEPQSRQNMEQDVKKWREKNSALKDCHDDINFQTEFVVDFCQAAGYDVRCARGAELFKRWNLYKTDDILTYRDKSFHSIFTQTASPIHEPWLTAFDDSLKGFVKS